LLVCSYLLAAAFRNMVGRFWWESSQIGDRDDIMGSTMLPQPRPA